MTFIISLTSVPSTVRLMSTFRELSGSGPVSDNCLVSVGYYGPQLYAMTETSRLWRINQDDLSAEKQVGRVQRPSARHSGPKLQLC